MSESKMLKAVFHLIDGTEIEQDAEDDCADLVEAFRFDGGSEEAAFDLAVRHANGTWRRRLVPRRSILWVEEVWPS